MKKIFHDYSYSIIKMFVDQFAIAIFGTSLTFATAHMFYSYSGSQGFDTLTFVVSICSVIFYLWLLYMLTWEIGAKDRDSGKKPKRPNLGLALSLMANIPNLILAVLYAIANIFNGENMMFIVRFIASLLQGMYFGIITSVYLPIGGQWVQLNSLWPTFFLMSAPAILVCWGAYRLGFNNFKFIKSSEKKPQEKPKMK